MDRRRRRLRCSDRAWLVLAAGIFAYESVVTYDELLSCAVDRYLVAHPIATRAVIIVTAAHLLNVLPERVDPYHGFGHLLVWKGRKVVPG